jgi:hypothetical protein
VSLGSSYPATPGFGLWSNVSEIAETPAQPLGPRSVLSRFDPIAVSNCRPNRDLNSQPVDVFGLIIGGT